MLYENVYICNCTFRENNDPVLHHVLKNPSKDIVSVLLQ